VIRGLVGVADHRHALGAGLDLAAGLFAAVALVTVAGVVHWLRFPSGQHRRAAVEWRRADQGRCYHASANEVLKRFNDGSNSRFRRFCIAPTIRQCGSGATVLTRAATLRYLESRCNDHRRHFQSFDINHPLTSSQHRRTAVEWRRADRGRRYHAGANEVLKRFNGGSNSHIRRFRIAPTIRQCGSGAPVLARASTLKCLESRCNDHRRRFQSFDINHPLCQMPYPPEPNRRLRTCVLRARAPPGYALRVVRLPT
jgi:hypothetical protein